jgi:hypothetical protein
VEYKPLEVAVKVRTRKQKISTTIKQIQDARLIRDLDWGPGCQVRDVVDAKPEPGHG